MSRLFAIGDIHGHVNKLNRLLTKISPEKGDKFVFLGDYIDRGLHSKAVIDCLIEFSKHYDCVFLSGNHEDMLRYYMEGYSPGLFLNNGGRATLESYGGNELEKLILPEDHIQFFRYLENYHEIDDYVFVHAGFSSCDFLSSGFDQELDCILWIRQQFIQDPFDFGKKIIFGHTPKRNGVPLFMDNKIGIDTGAAWNGPITALQIPEETYIQSE